MMTEAVVKEKKFGLFDILNNINSGKDRELFHTANYEKEYNPFMINRALMQNQRTIMVAQSANQAVLIDKEMHHDYLLAVIKKNNSRAKWKKKDDKSEYLEHVMQYYNVNEKKALQYLNILTIEECKVISKKFDKGGKVGKGSKA